MPYLPYKTCGAAIAVLAVTFSACRTNNAATSMQSVVTVARAFDPGIYWYGNSNKSQKFVKGQPNPYYDKTKPTVIYTHGWQRGFEKKGQGRHDFLYRDPTTQEQSYSAQAWIDRGWNVGEFAWDQLADEDYVFDAEAKIWSPNGDQKMRWRRDDGTYTQEGQLKISVTDLYYQTYLDALADYEGDNIRLVGHSLGTQLTARVIGQLYDDVKANKINPKLMPKRAALLDPFWMQADSVVRWPGARVREIVRKTKDDHMAWEMIKTSEVLSVPVLGPLFADRNHELTKLIGELVFRPSFVNTSHPISNLIDRHAVAVAIYFLSMSTHDPVVAKIFGTTGGVLAAASDEQVLEFMARGKSYRQVTPMANILDMAIPLSMYDVAFIDPTGVSTTVDNELPGAQADDPDAHEASSRADDAVAGSSDNRGDSPDVSPADDPARSGDSSGGGDSDRSSRSDTGGKR